MTTTSIGTVSITILRHDGSIRTAVTHTHNRGEETNVLLASITHLVELVGQVRGWTREEVLQFLIDAPFPVKAVQDASGQ